MLKVLSLSLMLVLSMNFHGQTPVQNVENPLYSGKSNLETQYKFILDQSRTYVNNKVIKIEWINKFYSNTVDSLAISVNAGANFETSLLNERGDLKDALEAITNLKEELVNVNSEKENITLFGSPTSKGSYKTIVWSIIIVLMILLLFFLYKFKSSSSITKGANEKLEYIEKELEETKKKTRTREQELMRKLQDEINKNS